MWSEVPAMQVFAWRMLQRLKSYGWPSDLLEQMYLEEDLFSWAAAAETAKKSQMRSFTEM